VVEKVIGTQQFQKNTFDLKLGQTLDLEFLSDFLDSNAFEREDFVYEPGQYAVRGGIVDVFSF